MLSLEDQKSINLFTIKHLNERLRLDSGSVFHVRAGRYIYTKDGENAILATFIKLSQGLGTRDTVEFFAMDLLDPRQVIENVLLEIDCLPTWSWSDDPYYSWHEGQFAHESNFKCSMSFMQSLKG